MKRLSYFLLAILFCFSLGFTSCGDDNKSGGDPIKGEVGQYAKYSYSNLTPEKQKEKLQEDASAVLTQLEGIKDESCYKVLKEFDRLLNISNPKLKKSHLESSDDLIYIKDYYGKYTWNTAKKGWDKSPSTDCLEFNFPVLDKAASIVVTGVASNVNIPDVDYLGGYWDEENSNWVEVYDTLGYQQLPKELLAKVNLGGTQVGSVEVSSDIVSEKKVPANSTATYNLGSYTMQTTVKKGSSESTVVSTFKKGNTVLLSATADLSGNLDEMVNDESSNGFVGNAVFEIGTNLILAGTVDNEAIAKYQSGYPKYPYYEDYDTYKEYLAACKVFSEKEKKYYQGLPDVMNKNMNIFLISRSDKTKIAQLVFNVIEHTDLYGEDSYSYWEQSYSLRFNDRTVVDADVYFSEGFSKLINNWEKFIANFRE